MVESTCLSMKFMFSGAHRVRFSEAYGGVHGHNYEVTIRLCVRGRRMLVADIDRVRREVQGIVNAFDGKYVKSSMESAQGLSLGEVIEIPCIPEGATGECVAWYFMDRTMEILRRLGINDVVDAQVIVCDSPINCFEAKSS
ncbi:6-pyruvoyl trahydropterin synthase family protein [Vulcanisaeta sp. JCM 16161]|uniref:6-pyruvoyl trahydropterin synthase family protein n=1 Tax=Vulcanisaeta sp. JCM 16161 TaxID=1295372 RepID=UPI000ABB8C52